MALFATIYAATIGIGFWTPVKAIAETVFDGATSGASAIALGIVLHATASVVFGVLFALLTPRDVLPAPAFALGTFAGLCIFVAMTFNPFLHTHLIWGSSPHEIPVVAGFAMHMIYGAVLSLAPRLRRAMSAEKVG